MHVKIPLGIHGISFGKKQLPYHMAVFAEQMLINIHKKALPYSSGRLFIGKVGRFFLKAQLRETDANSTGSDQDDLETAVL